MTVEDLLGRITSQEITEWKAFFIMRNQRREKATRPKEQSPAEARAVLGALVEQGRRPRRH
jgi:hypothetical protein